MGPVNDSSARACFAQQGDQLSGCASCQAVAQLLCLEAQGLMQELHVFARQSAKGGVFCEKMSKMLKSGIHHSNEAQDAVGQADIIVTATTSSTRRVMTIRTSRKMRSSSSMLSRA